MQGNDLGGWYTKRQVVVFEPLVVQPPEHKVVSKLRRLGTRKMKEADAEEWTINTRMCQWIQSMGYRFSMPTEVWSFLDEDVFDRLQPRVDRICGDYVVEWVRWGTIGEAYAALRANPDIVTVYDADIDRVEMYWHFRGCRVPLGGFPQ